MHLVRDPPLSKILKSEQTNKAESPVPPGITYKHGLFDLSWPSCNGGSS